MPFISLCSRPPAPISVSQRAPGGPVPQIERRKQCTKATHPYAGAEAAQVTLTDADILVAETKTVVDLTSYLPSGCLPDWCVYVKPGLGPAPWRTGTWRTPSKSWRPVWPCWRARKEYFRTSSVWPSSISWTLVDEHHTSSAKVCLRAVLSKYDVYKQLIWMSFPLSEHSSVVPTSLSFLPLNFFFYFMSGKSMEVEGGVRRAAQTAPPRYGPTLEDTRTDMERLWVWWRHPGLLLSTKYGDTYL